MIVARVTKKFEMRITKLHATCKMHVEEKDKLNEEIVCLKKEILDYQEQNRDLHVEIKRLRVQITEFEELQHMDHDEDEAREHKLKKTRDQLKRAKDHLHDLEKKYHALKDENARLLEFKDKCHHLEEEVKIHLHTIHEWEEKYHHLEDEHHKLMEKHSHLKKRCSELEISVSKHDGIIHSLEEQCEHLKHELHELKEKYHHILEEHARFKESHDRLIHVTEQLDHTRAELHRVRHVSKVRCAKLVERIMHMAKVIKELNSCFGKMNGLCTCKEEDYTLEI